MQGPTFALTSAAAHLLWYNFTKPALIEVFPGLGVLTWTHIETDGFENNKFLNKIKSVRGYNYEVKIDTFYGINYTDDY